MSSVEAVEGCIWRSWVGGGEARERPYILILRGFMVVLRSRNHSENHVSEIWLDLSFSPKARSLIQISVAFRQTDWRFYFLLDGITVEFAEFSVEPQHDKHLIFFKSEALIIKSCLFPSNFVSSFINHHSHLHPLCNIKQPAFHFP